MDVSWGPVGSAEIAYRQEQVRRDVALARGGRRGARRRAAGPVVLAAGGGLRPGTPGPSGVPSPAPAVV